MEPYKCTLHLAVYDIEKTKNLNNVLMDKLMCEGFRQQQKMEGYMSSCIIQDVTYKMAMVCIPIYIQYLYERVNTVYMMKNIS